MTAPIPLNVQAAAVERVAANHRGHVDNLRKLVAGKKRPQHEYDIASGYLPALEAAAKTMRWMAENESKIRAAIGVGAAA